MHVCLQACMVKAEILSHFYRRQICMYERIEGHQELRFGERTCNSWSCMAIK